MLEIFSRPRMWSAVRTAFVSSSISLAACGGGGGGSSGAVTPAIAMVPGSAQAGPLLPSGPTLADSSDWPTFAHDMLRTSIQPTSTIDAANVASLQPVWSFRSTKSIDLAGPIEANGIVYVCDVGGNLTALDAVTGAIRWQRSIGTNVKMTPSVYDGHLFVGTLDNSSPTAHSTLYALDPTTGAVQWQTKVDGGLHGAPVVVAGHMFVPVSLGDPGFCHPGGVYMFDEATGSAGLSWLTGGAVASDGGAVWSPVSYDGTRVYFGTGNTCVDSPTSANAIVAIETSTKLDWTLQTGPPMTDDDVGGGVLNSGGTAYVTSKNGKIYALDPTSGAVYFERALGAPDLYGSYSTPAAAGETLITSIGFRFDPFAGLPAGTQYGRLLGLDRHTGQTLWTVDAVAPFVNPPAIVGNVAFTVVDGDATALDASTGKTLWTSPIEAVTRSQPIVAKDQLFVAETDGDLYAYALPTVANAARRRATAERMRSTHAHTVDYAKFLPAFCRLR